MLAPIDLLKSKPTFEIVKKMPEYHKFLPILFFCIEDNVQTL